MAERLIMFPFTTQAIISIFLVIFLGWILIKFNFFDKQFVFIFANILNKYLLPFFFFWIIANNKRSDGFGWKVSLIMVLLTIFACLIGYLIANISNISEESKSLFIIGCYRFDLFLGLGFIYFLFSSDIVRFFCIILLFLLPISDISYCLIAKRFRQLDKKEGYDLKEIKSIIFNPIIIGGILGWASSSFGLDFPLLIDKTAEMIIMMIFPLVLITTGGSIKFGSTSPNEKAFVVGIASKIVVLPLLSYFFLTSMSVLKNHLSVVIIFFCVPSFLDGKIFRSLYKNENNYFVFHMTSILISFFTMLLWAQIL